MAMPATGTVTVTMSDPPSCSPPNGPYQHVFVTVRSVQAHVSASADDNAPGWQELAPQLGASPQQIDLFSTAQTNCVLAQLGSAELPAGSFQQIRLLLVSNSPVAGAAVPAVNACAGHGFNCVELQDTTIHQLDLSSQDNTGLKIPPGQIVGGPIQVVAGQSVDLNIDFNACASIVKEGNGSFRLKPALTAGQVSPNNSGISGHVVDSLTKAPIVGAVQVAIEQTDGTGVDRILMQTTADKNGNFRFCPLPQGTFDIVIVAIGPSNVPYNATAVLNVTNGAEVGAVPLVAEKGALGPALLQGFVTAKTASGGATADVSLAALQTISVASANITNRQLNIPLQVQPATPTSAEVDSTGLVAVSTNTNCPVGSPAGANCAKYTLVVPASNPSVGVFASGGTTYSVPGAGDVNFSVDARAAVANSGGVPDCTPSEMMATKDDTAQPLKVTAAMTTNVARIDFSGCQ